MCPIPPPAFRHAFKLLLPLFACSWGPTFVSPAWWNTNQVVHLYISDQSRGFYLQINPNGHVDRTQDQTVYTAVVRKTLNTDGHVNIIGAKTRFFLCMHSNGELFGSIDSTTGDCFFNPIWFEDYELYESLQYKLLVSLGSDKGPSGPDGTLPAFSQFSSKMNKIPLSQLETPQ